MGVGSCPEDYRCPTCGCDYRRLDATTWYCPFCDAKMVETEGRRLTQEETKALFGKQAQGG